MPRAGLTTDAVISAAVGEIDEHGGQTLTIAAVARRCGVAAPSLYKHVRDVAQLRALLSRRVLEELTHRLIPVVTGRSGYEALSELMRAWREYAVTHPNRYSCLAPDPLHDPSTHDAATRLLSILLAVLNGYGLTGPEAVHQARCVRSAVHGFIILEIDGGFGLAEDLDISFERVIHMVTSSLASDRTSAAAGG
jgi:AcrR family transcriptional regulator